MKRRGIIALALAAGLSSGLVAPATAHAAEAPGSSTAATNSPTPGQSNPPKPGMGTTTGQGADDSPNGKSSLDTGDAVKDFLLKFSLGVFAASAAFALLGMLRTLVFNIAHV
ncbi:hypothetical protein F7230_00330 [Corynebacterium sp. 320]|uniref:hypothetical protein n=1 Tax=Corynebacterium TaxID=1716 RepID=UPI00125CC3B1|nr:MULTISPECIES: hypothetical protein [Corynebacterium]KAB1503621.1 hypothetical protein F7230_00330 [Corynebacterium sp. 320]KAB1553278.1 hypothetical protein F7233_06260 [Corynebacterium sp. 321]KAB1553503.1 hypothetical protein F7232_00325 [Corynebacterium sp. 319]KAB3527757.1 hypothetical protein F8354_00330 [Corynebacterium sp. 250]KAB3540754.1 hypothetical protein F8390_06005 [Corynebacterium sp. 366]